MTDALNFASDNAGPVHPKVWEALRRADEGSAMPYGNDAITARAIAQIRDAFEAPDAAVFLVGTGTAANALALATLAQPWDAIFCTPMAHIEEDECGAPEFFTGGAKLRHVGGRNGKMTAADLAQAISGTGGSVHNAQKGPVSITNLTETGTSYSPAEIAALTKTARSAGLRSFVDGARFANACAGAGTRPAEMSWRAGIDALSFGGTKNGLMGVEAVLFFDPGLGAEFALRRKRGGHLFSKGRYWGAQMSAYMEGDLWQEMARSANAACAALAEMIAATPGACLLYPADGNMIFARFPRALHQALNQAGAQYYIMDGPLDGAPEEPLTARFVCDWAAAPRVERFGKIWGAL